MMAPRAADRRLVDMSERVDEEVYEPPPRHACEIVEFPFDLDERLRLTINQWIYRGRIVRFAVMLHRKVAGAPDLEVSRIDTCHGAVHRHRFTRAHGEDGDPVIIRVIPVDGSSWEVVDSEYQPAFDSLADNAEEYLRRWDQ